MAQARAEGLWNTVQARLRATSLAGFTLHAATRAGALDLAGREALLRYVLRPPARSLPSGDLRRSASSNVQTAWFASS